ncbi:MAG: FMN-binding protein [Gammaproteobacteria bacterium]|nr:FMN-binding protein [Gammaproteobacteria bacterium]
MADIAVNMKCFARGLRIMSAGLLLLVSTSSLAADEQYLSAAEFLHGTFGETTPEPSLIWLTGAKGETAKKILGHKPNSLRVRYWQRDNTSAWILDEIGREKPITAGFIIEDGALRRVEVLAFRESRGWEVRYDFFTKQFLGVSLTTEHRLDSSIDNITGATLSVSAMRRMAELALYLDSQVRQAAKESG